MSWAALTESDILARFNEQENDAYQEAGEDTPPRDKMTSIIAQVTGLVRGKVAACPQNRSQMGAAGTIPSEALWAAATIARDSLVASLPVSIADTDARKDELTRAHAILDSIAACEILIEDDDGTGISGLVGTYGGDTLLDFSQ